VDTFLASSLPNIDINASFYLVEHPRRTALVSWAYAVAALRRVFGRRAASRGRLKFDSATGTLSANVTGRGRVFASLTPSVSGVREP